MKRTHRIIGAALALSLLPALALAEEVIKGEVRKLDLSAGKVTLKHGPIKSLDMMDASMTMVFGAKDPAMLKELKVGDKVLFEADYGSAGMRVTKIEKAK